MPDLRGAFVIIAIALLLVGGVVGWAVIEGLIWLFTHIEFKP